MLLQKRFYFLPQIFFFLLQALGILALPQNMPVAVSNLGDLLDIIWHQAGNGSIDVSAKAEGHFQIVLSVQGQYI